MAGPVAAGRTFIVEPLARRGDPGVAVLPPNPPVAVVVLLSRVRGGMSSHIGRSAPPVPGGSFGQYGALPLPVIGRGGQGTRVPCSAGRGSPDGADSRVHGGVFLVPARGGSGPWWVSHMPHEGAAEDTEDPVHKGCVCCLGFLLSADGGLQSLAHHQRPDPVDREDGAQVGCYGGSTVRSRWGMAPSCGRLSRWNLHVAVQSLVCGQRRCAHRQRQ